MSTSKEGVRIKIGGLIHGALLLGLTPSRDGHNTEFPHGAVEAHGLETETNSKKAACIAQSVAH